MDDLVRTAATAFVTLVFGYLGWQLQLGGRRRRLRRDIVEELDLLKRLEPSDERDRLQQRVQGLLAAYEPDPATRPVIVFKRTLKTTVADIGIGIGTIILAADMAIRSDSVGTSIVIGAGAGTVLMVLGTVRGRTPVKVHPEG